MCVYKYNKRALTKINLKINEFLVFSDFLSLMILNHCKCHIFWLVGLNTIFEDVSDGCFSQFIIPLVDDLSIMEKTQSNQ